MEQTTNSAYLKNTGIFIGGILIGATVGGALGVLFAPDKGTETRKRIMEKGDDMTDAMKEKFNDFLETVRKDIEITKVKTHEMIENGKDKLELKKHL